MTNLNKYLDVESIIPSLQADTKEDAIKELVKKIYSNTDNNQLVPEKVALAAVLEREQLKSTGIGKGMAFPHARIEGWGELSVVAAICKEGLDFDSIDGEPVKCIFLMISSTEEPYVILQSMSSIVRTIREIKEEPHEDGKSIHFQDILEKITGKDIKASKHVLARDIARPIELSVKLDSSLEEVTHLMHFKRKSILPVVDENNKLCGEISCYHIFDYGMPDFFKQLNTISFVRHIDPFEKYFKLQKSLKVKDLLIKDLPPIREDATIAEIVFEMTTKQRSKLFMVDDAGVLTGVIDRFSIVDHILFF